MEGEIVRSKFYKKTILKCNLNIKAFSEVQSLQSMAPQSDIQSIGEPEVTCTTWHVVIYLFVLTAAFLMIRFCLFLTLFFLHLGEGERNMKPGTNFPRFSGGKAGAMLILGLQDILLPTITWQYSSTGITLQGLCQLAETLRTAPKKGYLPQDI